MVINFIDWIQLWLVQSWLCSLSCGKVYNVTVCANECILRYVLKKRMTDISNGLQRSFCFQNTLVSPLFSFKLQLKLTFSKRIYKRPIFITITSKYCTENLLPQATHYHICGMEWHRGQYTWLKQWKILCLYMLYMFSEAVCQKCAPYCIFEQFDFVLSIEFVAKQSDCKNEKMFISHL